MLATCPKDPSHKKFVTVIHSSQDALVNEKGFVEEIVTDLEIVAKPDSGNIWTCAVCNSEAIVVD